MAASLERRAYLRIKKREQRERARAQGKCIVCALRTPPAGMATCNECRFGIVDWQRRNDWPKGPKTPPGYTASKTDRI